MVAHYFTPAAKPMSQTRAFAPGSLTYRPDIDGLRAFAVLPVVLYHFGVPGFGGGFVGVDVFFVISGFLITSLDLRRDAERQVFHPPILRAAGAPHFSGVVRGARGRRWPPPSLVFFPRDLLRLRGERCGDCAFRLEFRLLAAVGIFRHGRDLKPLLHTWSLAVEEQFYLVFPALLYLMHTRKRATLLGLVTVLALASFALSVWARRPLSERRVLSCCPTAPGS